MTRELAILRVTKECLPCPFCGGSEFVVRKLTRSSPILIGCGNKDCRCAVASLADDVHEAIARWNIRGGVLYRKGPSGEIIVPTRPKAVLEGYSRPSRVASLADVVHEAIARWNIRGGVLYRQGPSGEILVPTRPKAVPDGYSLPSRKV